MTKAFMSVYLVVMGSLLAIANPPSHDIFDNLLAEHVSESGKVDYTGFKQDISTLNAYLSLLAEQVPNKTWNRVEQLAYWINAYNAFTIKLIVDHYPVTSIKDIEDGNPWDKKWIALGDEVYSLNNIEHDIIRPQFKDPRIHFAVNCAALSCPPLYNSAFSAERLNTQLENRTKAFIADRTYNRITESVAEVSKIFDWYQEDFGDVGTYLAKYSVFKPGGKVKFLSYDWNLNTQ